MRIEHTVTLDEDTLTLQQLLRGSLGLSARQAADAKRAGGVTVDGSSFFANQRVGAGRRVCVDLGEYEAQFVSDSAKYPVHVLYEDEALLAVRKPAPLQCHPSSSAPRTSDTLEGRVQAYLHAPAHPVHRLDAETTGIVLFAKLPYVQAHIQRQMQEGTFEKTYQAWVCGIPKPEFSVIDAPIACSAPDSFTRVVCAQGQHAVTRCDLLRTIHPSCAPDATLSLVSLMPYTGRTHQLRVHMAYAHCPLLGDMRYGSPDSIMLSRQMNAPYHQLSAVSLHLIHPLTGKPLALDCPPDFAVHPE